MINNDQIISIIGGVGCTAGLVASYFKTKRINKLMNSNITKLLPSTKIYKTNNCKIMRISNQDYMINNNCANTEPIKLLDKYEPEHTIVGDHLQMLNIMRLFNLNTLKIQPAKEYTIAMQTYDKLYLHGYVVKNKFIVKTVGTNLRNVCKETENLYSETVTIYGAAIACWYPFDLLVSFIGGDLF